MADRADSRLLGGGGGTITTRKKLVLLAGISLVIAIVVVGISLAVYYKVQDDKTVNLSKSLSVLNVMGHLQQLNALANTYGNGSRSVTDAYAQSANYVIGTLSNNTSSFCDIEKQYFNVPIYVQLSPPTLTQLWPLVNLSYVVGRDFSGTRYGGNGTYAISGEAIVVSNYGCNYPDDFQDIDITGNIAVMFDGNCTQYQKALNAEAAGASALLIVNNRGNALANWRVRSLGWNSSNPLVQIPVLGITYSLGLTLREQNGTRLFLTTNTVVNIVETFNVLCLTRHGSNEEILVMGAHMDSVPEGPGINDNGSGTSTVLEVALEVARTNMPLKNKILFAWWGAEEIGLLGSRYFVNHILSQPPNPTKTFNQSNYLSYLHNNNTLLNLNFDMLGSPNYVRQVYNSTAQTALVNDASFRIQQLFEEYFNAQNTKYTIVPMSGGSDYLPFIENGIPAGALATGAGAIKTVQERDVYGGMANTPLDPCYHLSCDTVANIDQSVLQDMGKAAAYAVQKLATNSNLRKFLYP